ncbi:hypothetical protein E7811_16665 [Aliigemmobacter aestuarii]|uniref:Uncharacterized protein n=1 Tax=Aliigemmobacter aestuarii TaxID=1445661 RepID=A0A4S3MJH4_9RHOB|nr:hypothetical protein [Gemmobacter aestuarii]THD81537.1 hypothetical protein E7811_16665 [Gemmobacter aestuarii]
MTSDFRSELRAALAELRASHAAQGRAIKALEAALEGAVQGAIAGQPEATAPPSEHRRKHKPGRPPKIEGDPELRAFIAARVASLTFHQIADEVAAHFPPAALAKPQSGTGGKPTAITPDFPTFPDDPG